jgi:hypothetical protein
LTLLSTQRTRPFSSRDEATRLSAKKVSNPRKFIS